MVKYFSALLATGFFCLLSIHGTAQTVWKTFNHKNGFTIQLPDYFSKGIYVALIQYFDNTIDQDISLSVESSGNGTPAEFQSSFDNDLSVYKGISYKIFKPTWYVISGQNEDSIFYNKTIIRNGIQHHLCISYPAREKALFDAIRPRLSLAFRPD
jgi:hypothetical protein